MENRYIRLIETQAQIILDESKRLRGKNLEMFNKNDVEYTYYLKTIDKLIDQLNVIAPKLNILFEKEGIDYKVPELKKFDATLDQVREENIIFGAEPKLLEVIFASSSILSFIKEGLILSENNQNRLDFLLEEIEGMKGEVKGNIFSNLIEAKNTLEKSSFLGSSLISGKIIRASFDKIEGKDINEKIESLKKLGLVREKDGEESLLKANHYGRNLASHDLEVMPTASEALSFLSEAVKIVKITSSYLKNLQTKEKLD